MRIDKKAQKYLSQLEVKTRQNGTSFCCIRDSGKNEDLYNAIKRSHRDRFPYDFIYSNFSNLLESIMEYDIEDMDKLEDLRCEIVENQVNVYTIDLLKWLGSDLRNIGYIDYVTDNIPQNNFTDTLSMAQNTAIDEVMNEVINLLSK